MAFFIATGVISNDVVRRETTKGVLTTFRLETGAPRGRKLWIDIECWGHLAGTIARHGSKGRGVSVSGRLTQKTWRDKSTGDARHRIVVTALNVELLRLQTTRAFPNAAVVVTGKVERCGPTRSIPSGHVSRFIIRTARSANTAHRLTVCVEHWTPSSANARKFIAGSSVKASGALEIRRSDVDAGREIVLVALCLEGE